MLYSMTIKKIGEVKTYFNKFKRRQETKFFIVFQNNSKSMFPDTVFPFVKEGDIIKFEGELKGEWLNVDQQTFKVEVIGHDTTIVSNGNGNGNSHNLGVQEQISVQVEYVTKPHTDKGGHSFIMARNLQGQPVKSLYMRLNIIPKEFEEAVCTGYGTLQVKGKRGDNDTFFVDEILSCVPTTNIVTTEVELKNVHFGLHHISFTSANGMMVTIPQDKVPFPFTPIFEKIKLSFVGSIKVNGEFRKTGFFKKDKVTKDWKEQIDWIDTKNITFDFSSVDTDSIKKLETKYKEDAEYAKILATLRQVKAFTSFSHIKGMFAAKGLSVTTQQIEELYWDERYDRIFYDTLKAKASEIYASEEEFIFVIKTQNREFRIVETPTFAKATYIFDSSCETSLLLQRLEQTERMQIIRNAMTTDGKSIQQVLGFKGRVIHQDYDEWVSKILNHINEGIVSELEEKFVF